MFSCRFRKLALLSWVTLGAAGAVQSAVPEALRAPHMLVTVAQDEILATIEPLQLGSIGLAWVFVDAGVNSSRTKRAEAAIVPVRAAMTDYRFGEQALAASRTLATSVAWLGVASSELNGDPSSERLIEAVKASQGPQMLSVSYEYALDSNLKLLKVAANVSLVSTSMSKENLKKLRRHPPGDFNRRIVCVLPLAAGARDIAAENATLWAQENAKPLKQGIDRALAKLTLLAQRSLENYRDAAVANDNPKSLEPPARVRVDAEGNLVLNSPSLWTYYFKP